MKVSKRELLIGLTCLLLGGVIVFMYSRGQLNSNKKLTARILSNAVGSMQASQNLADSCSMAYDTVTACVSNLKTCDIDAETKKLDEFNKKRKNADEKIGLMNQDMKRIIEEVSATR